MSGAYEIYRGYRMARQRPYLSETTEVGDMASELNSPLGLGSVLAGIGLVGIGAGLFYVGDQLKELAPDVKDLAEVAKFFKQKFEEMEGRIDIISAKIDEIIYTVNRILEKVEKKIDEAFALEYLADAQSYRIIIGELLKDITDENVVERVKKLEHYNDKLILITNRMLSRLANYNVQGDIASIALATPLFMTWYGNFLAISHAKKCFIPSFVAPDVSKHHQYVHFTLIIASTLKNLKAFSTDYPEHKFYHYRVFFPPVFRDTPYPNIEESGRTPNSFPFSKRYRFDNKIKRFTLAHKRFQDKQCEEEHRHQDCPHRVKNIQAWEEEYGSGQPAWDVMFNFGDNNFKEISSISVFLVPLSETDEIRKVIEVTNLQKGAEMRSVRPSELPEYKEQLTMLAENYIPNVLLYIETKQRDAISKFVSVTEKDFLKFAGVDSLEKLLPKKELPLATSSSSSASTGERETSGKTNLDDSTQGHFSKKRRVS